jgi:hypothetical protein
MYPRLWVGVTQAVAVPFGKAIWLLAVERVTVGIWEMLEGNSIFKTIKFCGDEPVLYKKFRKASYLIGGYY